MPWIDTDTLTPTTQLTSQERLQVYNGLDCCVTLEVFQELGRQFNQPPAIYGFERALQAPYLEIMQRGFRINTEGRDSAIHALRKRVIALDHRLQEMAYSVWDKGLNATSPTQLADFLYNSLHLPEVWLSQKGTRKLSTNREALEKLELYLHARPIIACILRIRDLAKQIQVFETDIDPDGRFRTSYNIAGTETGRPSSSENAFGTGGNAQNVAPHLRHVFVSDPGHKLVSIDLEQVEARDVGFFCGCLFNDWEFLDACESGDLHTTNARRVWPEIGWTDDPRANRKLADAPFYRDFTYRDMAKRGSHLSNYSGTAWTMSRALKIPLGVAEEFQARYCRGRVGNPAKGLPGITPAFPAIPRYWQWVAKEIQTVHQLTTPFGRRRHFFGRPDDDTTIREAIAFLPQSTTADRMNLGLWRVWRHQPEVQLLAQTYDSITFQLKEDNNFDDHISTALEHLKVELVSPSGRHYVVPAEAKTGYNWGNASPTNPLGLAKWTPQCSTSTPQTGYTGGYTTNH